MLKIQYRDAKDGGIEVLRCFSKEDQVEIPSEIEGKRVTKIGDYAKSIHNTSLRRIISPNNRVTHCHIWFMLFISSHIM